MANRIVLVAPDRDLAERVRSHLDADADELRLISPEEEPFNRALLETADYDAYLVSLDAPDPLAWISRLRNSNPRSRVIATTDAAPVEMALAALDAGADECLDVTGDLLPLMRALEQASDRDNDPGGRLICFLSASYAAGASTAAAYCGATLASEGGERVLLVELDFHSGALAFRLRLEPEKTIAELSRYWHIPDQAWDRAVCRWNGIDVIAAPESVHELRLRGLPPFHEIIQVARRRYQTVVADLPTGMSAAAGRLMRNAWRTYLLCTPELPSLHLARRRLGEMQAAGVDKASIRLVMSRWSARTVLSEEEVIRVIGLPITHRLPNDYASIRQADLEGRPIGRHRPLARALRKVGRAARPAGAAKRARIGIGMLQSF